MPFHEAELTVFQFPWLGLACLLIALATLVFSFLIFHFINHEPEIESKYLKPASWLSAIVSVNSIALHVALAEGVTTAWWYKASKADVTLQELHETWNMGTSTMAVLLAGKKFNYVAMATIFVATVPLNGFILQNAVALEPSTMWNITTVHVPIAQQLPLGFSAIAKNGSIVSLSEDLSSATSSLSGLTTLPPGVTQLGHDFDTIGCINKDFSAVCKAQVVIAGFSMSCRSEMVEAYDLRPSQHSNQSEYRATVYSSSVTWNAAKPNLIGLEVKYKPNETCQGYFESTTCVLEAAKMSIPIQINSDQGYSLGTEYSGASNAYPVISTDASAAAADFKPLGPLPKYAGEGTKNSTYGGIAQWLGHRFNGSIDWTLRDGSWSTNSTGTVANSYLLNTYPYTQNDTDGTPIDSYDEFKPKPDNSSWCKHTYRGLDWVSDYKSAHAEFDMWWFQNNPTDTIFVTLNQLMLSASVAQGYNQYYNLQSNETTLSATADMDWTEYEKYLRELADQMFPPLSANQTQNVLRYNIRYGYYGASVAITISIILMIIPLFYGFWMLDHRATLSPFETAAAFKAPGLEGADMKKGTDVLLKEIGTRPLHAVGSSSSLPLPPPPVADTRYNSPRQQP